MSTKNTIYVRIKKGGKIHAGYRQSVGKNAGIYINCKGTVYLHVHEIIPTLTPDKEPELCKTCIRMGKIKPFPKFGNSTTCVRASCVNYDPHAVTYCSKACMSGVYNYSRLK